jgi:hypothetical protein
MISVTRRKAMRDLALVWIIREEILYPVCTARGVRVDAGER